MKASSRKDIVEEVAAEDPKHFQGLRTCLSRALVGLVKGDTFESEQVAAWQSVLNLASQLKIKAADTPQQIAELSDHLSLANSIAQVSKSLDDATSDDHASMSFFKEKKADCISLISRLKACAPTDTNLQTVVEVGKDLLERLKAEAVHCVKAPADEVESKLQPVSGGVGDGSSWKAGIAVKVAWADVVKGSTELRENFVFTLKPIYDAAMEAVNCDRG
eukprot:6487762-Amphidinium_carterae.2